MNKNNFKWWVVYDSSMRTFTRNLGRDYYAFRSKVRKSVMLFAPFFTYIMKGKKVSPKLGFFGICFRFYQSIRSDLWLNLFQIQWSRQYSSTKGKFDNEWTLNTLETSLEVFLPLSTVELSSLNIIDCNLALRQFRYILFNSLRSSLLPTSVMINTRLAAYWQSPKLAPSVGQA